MLKRDYLTFADAVDPDQARAHGAGVDGARMLNERLAVHVQTPHLDVEADINARFGVPHHKNTGESKLMVLSNGRWIQWKLHFRNLRRQELGENLSICLA